MKIFFYSFLAFYCFSTICTNAETISDNLEIRLDIRDAFSLSVETYMIPTGSYDPKNLLQPSQNINVSEKKLDGIIDMGHLIARKQGDTILPLISEYKVLMQITCETNRNIQYSLSQTLNEPLKGVNSGELFPETAFVYLAGIDNSKGLDHGKIMLSWESPVLPNDATIIYNSGDSDAGYLGNTINICYWISDQQDDKVYVSQRADTYNSTITITMIEI